MHSSRSACVYIEPFITGEIASKRAEEDMLYYYDAQGQLLAEVIITTDSFVQERLMGKANLIM